MNYSRVYDSIIQNRLCNPYIGYTERHHILPVSLGGADTPDNLVDLSAREHFLCHWLLVKIHSKNKPAYFSMLKAFNMMSCAATASHHRYRPNSRVFQKYREDFSKCMSEMQTGSGNSQYGKIWVCNLSTKESKKAYPEDIPDGWVKGRNKWNTPSPGRKKERSPRKDQRYLNGYRVSVDGVEYVSISHAADSLGLNHETARMRFKNPRFTGYNILTR